MSKWTPGPWRVGDIRVNGEVLIHGDRQIVATVIQGHREYAAETNARLVAASPELAEELEAAIADLREVWARLPQRSAERASEREIRHALESIKDLLMNRAAAGWKSSALAKARGEVSAEG